ncbi:PREDICTED: beta-taxilin isoform X2 [Cyprinodon variegatus]|uniref:beta-taxilin isoform X2 n=1 Tax=Cyprinodon variegatus TaxID=28743 RepID=UPI000742CAE9|nr:PREDICTED: beta-taxilin isoform X2 [Cyprinodon variegatus]
METSVEAAELVVPPRPDAPSSLEAGSPEGAAATSDPMEEFSRRLQDILRTHGSADGLLDRAVASDLEAEKEEVKGDVETDVSVIKQRLISLSSPEEKLEELLQKYSELVALRRAEQQRVTCLQQKLCVLQAERRCGAAARSQLEDLCRDLQAHYSTLREETLRRCREDEEKRSDITSHFQEMLTEIQAQIEQHSARNDKLCHENANLTDKLESLMNQYERREESLDKINKHRDLQHKLTEAKLQQANALLAEAEEKHKREKEYLLVQAAEWKLQAKTLREQATVMQAQLTLYAQKFDEFQATLAKSNEIYVRFRKEMDNMTEKMKKVEKEANLWKTRFENCNKTLIDMIEERAEKGREYDLFVLKIQKLEKLCRALQDERKGLYDKIRDVRQSTASLPSKFSAATENVPEEDGIPDLEGLQELQEEDPVLLESIARLREEQAKLQEFAASLLAAPDDEEQREDQGTEAEDDLVVSAIAQFQTKPEAKRDPGSAPESGFTQTAKEEKDPDPSEALMEAPEPEGAKPEPADPVVPVEAGQDEAQVQFREEQQAKRDEHVQQSEPAEVDPEPEEAKAYPEPNALEADQDDTSEVKPVLPVEAVQVQEQPVSGSELEPEKSAQPSEAAGVKPLQKKRKKRNSKSTS